MAGTTLVLERRRGRRKPVLVVREAATWAAWKVGDVLPFRWLRYLAGRPVTILF